MNRTYVAVPHRRAIQHVSAKHLGLVTPMTQEDLLGTPSRVAVSPDFLKALFHQRKYRYLILG
jgi:hypothetical protein